MATPDDTGGPEAPRVFTDEQRGLLRAILDRLVPADGPLPSAGALDVDLFIERAVFPSAFLRRMFTEGFRLIEIEAARRGGSFQSSLPEAQDGVLVRAEGASPLFFAWLVDLTYRGYYVSSSVHAALGYDGGPPQPRGYPVAPFDVTSLDRQRSRLPLWRPAPSESSGQARG